MDETGTHDKEGIIRVAGLLAPHAFWPSFNQRWCDICNDSPTIRYWHTNSAHHGKLYTRGENPRPLTEEEALEKELRFASLIGESAGCLLGMCIEVSAPLYRKRVIGKLNPHKKFRNPLWPVKGLFEDPVFGAMREAVICSVTRARHWNQALRPEDPLHVWSVFEENESSDWQQFQLIAYVQMLKNISSRETRRAIGPCVFVPGKGGTAWTTVEAADLYAWHIYNTARTKDHPAWQKMKGLPFAHRKMTEEVIDEMVEAINTGKRFEF